MKGFPSYFFLPSLLLSLLSTVEKGDMRDGKKKVI